MRLDSARDMARGWTRRTQEASRRRELSNVSLLSSVEVELPEGVFATEPWESKRLLSSRLPPVPRISSLMLREILPPGQRWDAGASRYGDSAVLGLKRRRRDEAREVSEDDLELLLGGLDEDKENVPAAAPPAEDEDYREDYESTSSRAKQTNPLEALEVTRRCRRLEQGRKYAAEKRRALSVQRAAESDTKRRTREAIASNLKQLHENARRLAKTPLPEDVSTRLKRERSERRRLFENAEVTRQSSPAEEQKRTDRPPAPPETLPLKESVAAPRRDGAPARQMSRRQKPSTRPLPSFQQFKATSGPKLSNHSDSLGKKSNQKLSRSASAHRKEPIGKGEKSIKRFTQSTSSNKDRGLSSSRPARPHAPIDAMDLIEVEESLKLSKERRSQRHRMTSSQALDPLIRERDQEGFLLQGLHAEVARNNSAVQSVRAQMERMQSLLQEMHANQGQIDGDEDDSILDLRKSLLLKVETLRETEYAPAETVDSEESIRRDMVASDFKAVDTQRDEEDSIPLKLHDYLKDVDLKHRPPSRGTLLPHSKESASERSSAFRSTSSAPNNKSEYTNVQRTAHQTRIGGEYNGDPLLYHQLGSLQDKKEILSRYVSESHDPSPTPLAFTDEAYESSLRNVGELAGVLDASLEMPMQSLDSESELNSETSSEGDDENGDHRMITIFAREIIRQREREQQARVEEEYIRSVVSSSSIKGSNERQTETLDVPSQESKGIASDFSNSAFLSSPAEIKGQDSDEGYSSEISGRERYRGGSHSHPTPHFPRITMRTEEELDRSSGKSPAELRLEMERELLNQQRIFEVALEISDLQQNQLATTAARAVRTVEENARAKEAEVRRREELLTQRHAYETELFQLTSAARLEMLTKDLEHGKEMEAMMQSKMLSDLHEEYRSQFDMARETAQNLERMAMVAELEHAATSQRTVVETSVQTEFNEHPTPYMPFHPKPVSSRDASIPETEDSVILGDDDGTEDYSNAFDEEVLAISKDTVVSKNPSEVSTRVASVNSATGSSRASYPFSRSIESVASDLKLSRTGSNASILIPASKVRKPETSEVEYSDEFDNEQAKNDSNPPPQSSAMEMLSRMAAPPSEFMLSDEYKAELERRIASHERSLTLRQQFLQSRKMYQLALTENQKAQLTTDAYRMEVSKIEMAFEEGRAEIERDRWAMQARTFREMRKLQDLQDELDDFKSRIALQRPGDTGRITKGLSQPSSASYPASFGESYSSNGIEGVEKEDSVAEHEGSHHHIHYVVSEGELAADSAESEAHTVVIDEFSEANSVYEADSVLTNKSINEDADVAESVDSFKKTVIAENSRSLSEADQVSSHATSASENNYTYDEDFEDSYSRSLRSDHPKGNAVTIATSGIEDVFEIEDAEHSVDTLADLEESVERRRTRIDTLKTELEITRSEMARKLLIKTKEEERRRLLEEEELLLHELRHAKSTVEGFEQDKHQATAAGAAVEVLISRTDYESQTLTEVPEEGVLSNDGDTDLDFERNSRQWIKEKVSELKKMQSEELEYLTIEDNFHSDSFGSSDSCLLEVVLSGNTRHVKTENDAAIQIQSVVRGHLVRREFASQNRLCEMDFSVGMEGDLTAEIAATNAAEDRLLEDSFGSGELEDKSLSNPAEIISQQVEAAAIAMEGYRGLTRNKKNIEPSSSSPILGLDLPSSSKNGDKVETGTTPFDDFAEKVTTVSPSKVIEPDPFADETQMESRNSLEDSVVDDVPNERSEGKQDETRETLDLGLIPTQPSFEEMLSEDVEDAFETLKEHDGKLVGWKSTKDRREVDDDDAEHDILRVKVSGESFQSSDLNVVAIKGEEQVLGSLLQSAEVQASKDLEETIGSLQEHETEVVDLVMKEIDEDVGMSAEIFQSSNLNVVAVKGEEQVLYSFDPRADAEISAKDLGITIGSLQEHETEVVGLVIKEADEDVGISGESFQSSNQNVVAVKGEEQALNYVSNREERNSLYEQFSTSRSTLDIMKHVKIEAIPSSGWDISVTDSSSHEFDTTGAEFDEVSNSLTTAILRNLLAETVDEVMGQMASTQTALALTNENQSGSVHSSLHGLPPVHLTSLGARKPKGDEDSDDLYNFDEAGALPLSVPGFTSIVSPSDVFADAVKYLDVRCIDRNVLS